MKKYIPLLLAVCFFAFSCKKDHHPGTDPNAKTYEVKFGLNGFTQSIASATGQKVQANGLKANATPVPVTNDAFKVIKYLVYGANNVLLRNLTIDSTASNFGSIADFLPAGTYTIGIAAGQAGLDYLAPKDNYPSGLYYTTASGWKDTFFNKFQLTVSGNVNQNVTLTRIVGQLQINIEDAIPLDAKSISVTVTNEYAYYSLFLDPPKNTPSPSTTTITIPDAAKGNPNFKINKIINNTLAPFTVTIKAYGANQQSMGAGVTVTNVSCQVNTRTILSGKLFTDIVNYPFTVGLNKEWAPDPIIIHY